MKTGPRSRSLDHEHAALPADFFERSAYMRLYHSRLMSENFWPAAVFGDEINILLAREHAVPAGNGYRLTVSGAAHWEQIIKVWVIGDVTKRKVLPRIVQVMMTLEDGQWHNEAVAKQDISDKSWRGYVRPELVKRNCIELKGERGPTTYTGYVRLTANGQSTLAAMRGDWAR